MLYSRYRTEILPKPVRLRDLTRSRLPLYHRRGISTFMAENAACRRSRDVHRAFARAYTARIARVTSEQPLEVA